VKLYRARFSTNVERVTLALAHKGLSAESVWIEYSDRSPVEEISGQGLVPVLVDDDGVHIESMDIVRHLDERHPEPPLYPADAARREEMLVFIDWFNAVWKVAPNAIEAELEKAEPDHALVERHTASMAAALSRFEAMLDGRDYLMGDSFSAADIAAYPFLKYALIRDPEDDELFHRILEQHQRLGDGYPRLAEWIRRVGQPADLEPGAGAG
jgi:glutathione S-transferase